MANIKEYTDAIKNAVYGEQVRDSIIEALNKINASVEAIEAANATETAVLIDNGTEQGVADISAK